MKAKINDTLIAGLGLDSKGYAVCDTELAGFRVWVAPSGIKSFQLSYRNQDGTRKTYTLGKYGTITAVQARKSARMKVCEVGMGADIQSDKKKARSMEAARRQQTLGGFFYQRYKPYLETRKTAKRLIQALERDFVGDWADRQLAEINKWLLTSWRNQRLKSGIKPATVNRSIAVLKAMLTKAVEWEVLDKHPLVGFKKLKEDTEGIVRYLEKPELDRLLQALHTRQEEHRAERLRYIDWRRSRHLDSLPALDDRYTDYLMPMVLVTLHTGMRRGELFDLRWEDINFERKQLTVKSKNAKSQRHRHIPLNTEALNVLTIWRNQSAGKGLVFPSPVTGKRFDNITTAWEAVVESARIEKFRFHDLRHNFASQLVMKGVDLYTVKELLGHSTIEMTQRYAHLSPDHKAAAVSLLQDGM